jgi:ferredoxin--NADP+ reductase
MVDRISILDIVDVMRQLNVILEKKVLADGIHFIKVHNPLIAAKAEPGQFVIIRYREVSERIPLTLQDFDRNAQTINIVYQEVGKSTIELGYAKAGEVIMDIVGPLGKPSEIENYGTVVCIGGGVGTPEIYPVARAMKQAGNHVIGIIGARCKDMLIMEQEMRAVTDELSITTDDGSYGCKGFVTDALKELLEKTTVNRVFAVGPVIMMKAVSDMTRSPAVPTIVNLNPIMLDGTGMCGVCRVEVDGQTKFACVDGPEFDGHKVNYDLLVQRLQTYTQEEQMSRKLYEQSCEGKCHE